MADTSEQKRAGPEQSDEGSVKDSKAIQKFDGQLPPILPELRYPEEFLSRMGSGVRRRAELVNRAYSAAVYAHQDLFEPRRESLFSEPTKKLLRSEKEQILCLFAQECFIVLGVLREFGGMARPIPVAERITLFNDYQAWMNRLKELLREAVFADEPESWNQALINLLQNCKPYEPFPKKEFLYLVEKPVFSDYRYLSKFNELFLSQMEVEERFGLMIDIVLDLINAYEARMRKKMPPSNAKVEDAQRTDGLTGEALALAMLVEHPEWSDTKIAKAVGVHRATLYDWPNFKKVKEALKQGSERIEQKPPSARHSIDYRSVHWFGDDHTFTPNQAAAVKILWEAWENGTPEVGGDTIATEVESDSRRARDIFKGHPAFGTMICPGKTKGTFRLVEPDK